MKRRQSTLKDIAHELNISKSTVSRALRNANDVSEDTRRLVLATAHKLDYQPNISALNLMKGKTRTLGVCIPSFTIPFYAGAISGFQNEAWAAGYNIMVCQSNENYTQELSNINMLIRSGVDGIALSLSRETANYAHIQKLKQKGIPVVLFNRVVQDIELSTVRVDDYGGAEKLMQHLISQGNKRIAYIGGPSNLMLSQNRQAAYRDVLSAYQLPIEDNLLIESNFTIESGRDCCQRLLQSKVSFDALFCVCDAVAYGAIQVLKEAGLHIPGDVAVAGFTNEIFSEQTSPRLTTVSQPIHQIGQTTAHILIEHINHFSTKYEVQHQTLDTELIIRDST